MKRVFGVLTIALAATTLWAGPASAGKIPPEWKGRIDFVGITRVEQPGTDVFARVLINLKRTGLSDIRFNSEELPADASLWISVQGSNGAVHTYPICDNLERNGDCRVENFNFSQYVPNGRPYNATIFVPDAASGGLRAHLQVPLIVVP